MDDAAIPSAPLSLAGDFAAATREDWLKLVGKTLEGGDFDARLVGRTVDGLTIQPLYTPDDGIGVAAPVGPRGGAWGPGVSVMGISSDKTAMTSGEARCRATSSMAVRWAVGCSHLRSAGPSSRRNPRSSLASH